MLRRLRVLAAFFMVPVVVFITPTAAAAAPGPWTTVDFAVASAPLIGDSAPGTIDTIDCTLSLRNLGTYFMEVAGNGYCYGLPDVTWGYTQDGEAGSAYAVSVSGLSPGGACAGSSQWTLGPHAANGTLRVAGTIGGGTLNVAPSDCDVTEVCLTLASGRKDCVSVDISAPAPDEPPTSTCQYGTPANVRHKWEFVRNDSQYVAVWQLQLKVDLPFVGTGAGTTAEGWNYSVWVYDPRVTGPTNITSAQMYTGWPAAAGRVQNYNVSRAADGSSAPPPGVAVYGVEVYHLDRAGTGGWNTVTGTGSHDGEGSYKAGAVPTSAASNYGGVTDPARCRFYYGVQMVSFPDTEIDDPYGGVPEETPTEPVDETPPTIEQPPVIEPPSTETDWLGSIWALLRTIWQALVAGFNAVVNAVKGVAGAIVDGITGLFSDAFLPADGYMETKWSGVETKFDATSPGKYLDAVTSLDTGAVSGCSGLPLNVDLGGGVSINESIGAACSGTMASAASITRAVLTAVFGVAGAIACVRAIGSGLGWDPGLGRGNVS